MSDEQHNLDNDQSPKTPVSIAELIFFSFFSPVILFMPIALIGFYIGGLLRWRKVSQEASKMWRYRFGIAWSIACLLLQLSVVIYLFTLGSEAGALQDYIQTLITELDAAKNS